MALNYVLALMILSGLIGYVIGDITGYNNGRHDGRYWRKADERRKQRPQL